MLRICAAFVLLLAALPVQAGPSGAIRVIDGDTLSVGGVKVRLHGLDAPEVDQDCRHDDGTVWKCGVWASREVRARYQGARARCEAVTRDRYGRIVARCFVGERDIGRDLVADGIAFAFRRYSMDYDLEEKSAFVAGRGIWAGQATRPEVFRAEKRQARQARVKASPPSTDCRIKGNISGNGRIYHMPGQRDYAATSIRESRGERWFCTEAEAQAAGWRRARR